jgi:hypothetical protein
VRHVAAALLSAAAALPLPIPAAIRAVPLAIALGFVPGWLAARVIAPGAPGAMRALLGLSLSPFLAAAPAALLVLAGTPVVVAARVVAGVIAVLALLDLGFRSRRSPAPGARAETPPPDEKPAWIAAGIFTAVVAVLYAVNPFLAPRSDGWFHAAVTLQVAARGFPLEDPAFAGLPLLYFWGPALWSALWLALEPRMAVWTPWVALSLSAACATMLGVVALARRLGADARVQGFAAAVAVLGYTPFAWLMVAGRAMTGEVRGLPEVRRLLTLGADSALRALDPGVLHISLLFFADKFLVLTPFALGLALFAAFLLALLDLAERPGMRSAVVLALVLAAAFFTHTLVGATCSLLAGVAWLARLARGVRGDRASLRVLAPLAFAVIVAGVALAPYLVSVTAGKERQLANGFSTRSLISALLAGSFLVPAGIAWLARAARAGGAARDLLPLAITLVLLGLALGLPENNQSKFWNLGFLLLAPPAALFWLAALGRMSGARRAALAALLALALLPTAGASLLGFACERGQNEERTHFPASAMRAAWEWARSGTASDAVFVDAEGASDMLVLAGRSALWGGGGVERDWGHPASALEARRRASRELCRAAEPSRETRALLESLGREVIVVARAATGESTTAAPACVPIFRNSELSFYHWEAAR